MNQIQFLKHIKNFVIEAGITAPALRNQGAPLVVRSARDFCIKLDVSKFVTETDVLFIDELNQQTLLLQSSLPVGARNWGTARKTLNIVLREYLYNRYLCSHYQIERIENWLEIPLDQHVSNGINEDYSIGTLSGWPGIKHLTDIISNEYQQAASQIAMSTYDVSRVHLDTIYWRA